jgi:hypothetical protein
MPNVISNRKTPKIQVSSRELVRSEKKYLDHVNKNNRHHEIGSPAMHGADEPTEGDVVIQGLQAAPCFLPRGHIHQREQDSRHNLQHEHRQRRTAEHIPPTGGIPRHGMIRDFANWPRKLEPMVEPGTDFLNHDAHGGLSPLSLAIDAPGVGSSPAWMVIRPFSILYGYSKSPRSGGPEAREPSW